MAAESQPEWPNVEDGAMSEANSSVQVHLDSRSVRGLSTSRTHRSRSRRRSPSRNPEPETTIQPPWNSQQSQSSGLSSQPIHDTLPQEDLLIDLITPTEPSGSALAGDVYHGIKRPHDGETAGEPSPKRDKLGEELERMMAEAKREEEDQPSMRDTDARSTAQENGVVGPSTMARTILPVRHARKGSTQGAVQYNEQQQQGGGGGSSTTRSSSNSSTPKPCTPQGLPTSHPK